MSKVHKISFSIVLIVLGLAVIFGIITRFSYKNYDLMEAKVYLSNEECDEIIQSLNSDFIINELNSASSVFVLTTKSSENIHEGTRAVAFVDKVIKGDTGFLNKEIIINQINFIEYSKRLQQVIYNDRNGLNNIMQKDKQYLVFVDKVDFYKGFQKKLDYYEFNISPDLTLYSFPINSEINYINYSSELTYKDIEKLDYFCFNKKSAQKLQKIVEDVLSFYIN